MSQKKKILFILAFLFLLTGCVQGADAEYQTMKTPNIKRSPLEGRWIVTKVAFKNPESGVEVRNYIGKEAVFLKDIVIFSDEITEMPKYNMRKINTDKMLELRYNSTRAEVGLASDSLFQVEVFENSKPLFVVYRDREDVAYIDLYGNLLQVIKTKDNLDDSQIDLIKKTAAEGDCYHSDPF